MANPYIAQNTDFLTPIDVACPKCTAKAIVLCHLPGMHKRSRKENIRFSCHACKYALEYRNIPKFTRYAQNRDNRPGGRPIMINADCDPYFGFELWYCKETVHGLLWAYNWEHLAVIENYIASQQNNDNEGTHRNNPLLHHLTQWMKNANDNKYLLKVIRKLKQK